MTARRPPRRTRGRLMRRIIAAAFGVLMVSASAALHPAPVAAAWERNLTVTFYSGINFGDGRGRVTSDDGGIDCSYDQGVRSGDCTEHYILPDFQASYTVTLTLDPGVGSFVCVETQFGCQSEGVNATVEVAFSRTSGGDITKTPSFTRGVRKIIGNWIGPGSVHIDSGSACTPPDNYEFCFQRKYGDTVTLSAVPNDGKVFSYWSGSPCGYTDPSCSFALTENLNVFAAFGLVELVGDVVGQGDVCATSGASLCTVDLVPPVTVWVEVGATVTLEARPDSGWHFTHWNTGPCAGQDATCSYTVGQKATVIATFERNVTATASPKPTVKPTAKPTTQPTTQPTSRPSARPSATPTMQPANPATGAPTVGTTSQPTGAAPSRAASDPGATPPVQPDVSPAAGTSGPAATPAGAPGPTPAPSELPAASVTPGAGVTLDPLLLGVLGLLTALVLVVGFILGRRGGPAHPDVEA